VNSLACPLFDFLPGPVFSQVYIFKDRVEIVNPGGLVPGLKLEELGKRSLPRNPLLFDLMYRIEMVEKIGSGYFRIRTALSGYGMGVTSRLSPYHSYISPGPANFAHQRANLAHAPAILDHVPANLAHPSANLAHPSANFAHARAKLAHPPANFAHVPANLAHAPANLARTAAPLTTWQQSKLNRFGGR
jgi:hypothetical protein